MGKPCRDLDLPQKTLRAERCCEVGSEDLDRHLTVVLEVLGQVDRGHAATTDLALDLVAVGQGGAETVDIGHGSGRR